MITPLFYLFIQQPKINISIIKKINISKIYNSQLFCTCPKISVQINQLSHFFLFFHLAFPHSASDLSQAGNLPGDSQMASATGTSIRLSSVSRSLKQNQVSSHLQCCRGLLHFLCFDFCFLLI